MSATKYAIVGGGPAALSAAGAIRKRDQTGSITVIGAEKHPPYYRPLISYYLSGQVEREKLFWREEDCFGRQQIRFINARVVGIEGRQGKLILERPPQGEAREPEKEELKFEKLLIATGADPVKPDIPGLELSGVHFLRTIDQAEAIGRQAREQKKALIVGGGLVSLRAACALHKLGLEVTLVVSSAQLLSRMLDPQGADLVARHLAEQGIGILLQSDVARINGSGTAVEGVTLAGGEELEAGLVIIGKGVKPAVAFPEGCDIEINGGIPVNDKLQTSLAHVYAAGDAALCSDLLSGKPALHQLWPHAVVQGELAGANMAGAELTYEGSLAMNATEILGLPVMAAGLAAPGEDDPSLEIYTRCRPPGPGELPLYTRTVIRDNRLVGYVAVGAHRKAGLLTNLIMSRQPLSPYRKEQLKQGRLSCW